MSQLEYVIFDNTLLQWILSVLIFISVFTILTFLKKNLVAKLHMRTWIKSPLVFALISETIGRTFPLLIFSLSFMAGINVLDIPPKLSRVFEITLIAIFFLQLMIWANIFLNSYITYYLNKKNDQNNNISTAANVLKVLAKVTVFSLLLLLALDQVGINITALVAGLGIGGIAVALAVQNVLGDLLSSLSIILDRPFVVGDFLSIDNMMGTVEKVGLKTTRLSSLTGEQIIISNSDLLKGRIRNYKRMLTRRIEFSFGISYETSLDKIERIPGQIKRIIEGKDRIKFDRAHLKKFSESSLDFEVVYIIQDPDYNLYMDLQQSINLDILRAFRQEGIAFAHPARILHFRQGREEFPGDELGKKRFSRSSHEYGIRDEQESEMR